MTGTDATALGTHPEIDATDASGSVRALGPIAFAGLGTMGRAMAARLIEAGADVAVWNRSPGAADELAERGATRLDSIVEAFERPTVFTMFADDRSVRQQVLESGALERGCVRHVNHATVSTAFAHELVTAHREAGVAYVAAPVLGRSSVAEAGRLTVLAAGDGPAIAAVTPALETFAARIRPLGREAASANALKIAVNFLVVSAIEAMAEGSALVESYGLDAADLIDTFTGAGLPDAVYTTYGGLVATRTYEPAGFTTRLGLKDVSLALDAAAGRSVPLPTASLVRDALLESIAKGREEHDWASLGEVARERAGRA